MALIKICDVHKYALGDSKPREVQYCSFCDAYICEDCSWNLPLRTIALAERAKERFINLLRRKK